MNFEINIHDIENSFDRIAKDLLTNYALMVNETEIRFTEIEFYFFHEDFHKDEYTHEHGRNSGEWRFHNQGLDITFQSDSKSDGGILIRGILLNGKYINGPRKVVREIFEAFGKIEDSNCIKIKKTNLRETDILKTFRHLPNKNVVKDFHHKPYRYLTDLDILSISGSLKSEIKKNVSKL